MAVSYLTDENVSVKSVLWRILPWNAMILILKCQGLIAASDCGTPWIFLLPFYNHFVYTVSTKYSMDLFMGTQMNTTSIYQHYKFVAVQLNDHFDKIKIFDNNYFDNSVKYWPQDTDSSLKDEIEQSNSVNDAVNCDIQINIIHLRI